jgi:hypothetical protein
LESIRAVAETYSIVVSCLFDPSISIPSNAAGPWNKSQSAILSDLFIWRNNGWKKTYSIITFSKGISSSCRPHFTRRGSAAKPQ